jgi:hypothetical protein
VRLAIVGGGISGLAHAHVLGREGFDAVVFEKGPAVGGVWAVAYPEVTLQNVDFQYHLSDLPWAAPPEFHPTGAQIRSYWSAAVETLGLDVRLEHEVVSAEERDGGWVVRVRHGGEVRDERFDHLIVATGQYTEGKHRPGLAGEERFRGTISTERDVRAFVAFRGTTTVVVGFGKSALDVATLASERGAVVHHVFRTPRWALPVRIGPLHASWVLFSRFGSVMMTSWAHPTAPERALHRWGAPAVRAFWRFLTAVIHAQCRWDAGRADATGRERLRAVFPTHSLLPDLRSAAALAPRTYYRRVATGEIQPHHAEVRELDESAVVLSDGTRIPCDHVVLAVGSESPRFPFLPPDARALLESEPDGPQLYRHLVHPRLPNLSFAGLNHGFLHVPAAELGARWLAAKLRGDLVLPPPDEMERSIERVRAWKRAHIAFEPSRSCAVSTRAQQYLDILALDLGVSPYRKLPNVVAEVFGRYGSADYAGIDVPRGRLLRPIPVDT